MDRYDYIKRTEPDREVDYFTLLEQEMPDQMAAEINDIFDKYQKASSPEETEQPQKKTTAKEPPKGPPKKLSVDMSKCKNGKCPPVSLDDVGLDLVDKDEEVA